MAPLFNAPKIAADDPRLRVGSYISWDRRLGEVVQQQRDYVLVEDVKTGETFTVSHILLNEKWKLVREMRTEVPEYPPEFEEAS